MPCYFNVGGCACHGGPGCLADPPPTADDRRRLERQRRDAIRASYRPCSVCGDPEHAGVLHPDDQQAPETAG